MRILLTSMGSTASQNLALSLLESQKDLYLVGADAAAQHGGMDIAHMDVLIPRGDSPDYLSVLLELCQTHSVDLLIPVMEPELAKVSAATQELAGLPTRALVSSERAIQTCLSKRALASTLLELNIPTPRHFDSIEHVTSWPVFTRPNQGTGSRGAHKLHNREEFDVLCKGSKDRVFGEFVSGVEFSVDAFANASHEVLHLICRSRDEVRGGLAFRSTVVAPLPLLAERVQRIATRLGLVGFFNFQCIQAADGESYFFDLNPRLGGGMYLSFRAGLHPYPLLQNFLYNTPLPSFPYREGMKLFRRWNNRIVERNSAS